MPSFSGALRARLTGMADRQDQAGRSTATPTRDLERERRERFQRFGALRRAQPADATMKNLLELLTIKLELCERLPVWEWEAGDEGNETSAATFHAVLETERRTCDEVLSSLHEHIERVSGRVR
jgi:hypothetical protein